MKVRLMVGVTLLVSSMAARAQEVPGPGGVASGSSYVALKLGAVMPQHKDLDGFDSGLAAELTVGRRLSPNLAFEAGVGRFTMSLSATGFVPSIGQDGTFNEEVTAVSLTASLKPILPAGNIDFYGLLGASMYFISDSQTLSSPGFQDLTASDHDNSLGLHFGAGLSARLNPQFSMGAEAKYIIGSTKLYGSTSHFDSWVIGAMGVYHF